MTRLVDLSHPLVSGEQTYTWLPAPRVTEVLSRQASRERYAAGTEFAIHQVEVVGNSGTYLDAPFHRFASGVDLAGLSLDRVANLPGVVVNVGADGTRTIGPEVISAIAKDLAGTAVLFRTGWDGRWGSPDYPAGAPFLSRAAAEALVERSVALVGIDALNVDDTDDPTRPAHSVLLGAGVPIVENVRGLGDLPATGFWFTAAPAPVRGCGSFPVRAFAVVP